MVEQHWISKFYRRVRHGGKVGWGVVIHFLGVKQVSIFFVEMQQ